MGSTRTIGTPAPAYAGGQIATGGTLGLLGSTSVMNTPFSTTNFTSQLIENQQGRTAADTLINDASVRATTGANGFDDTLQIRGFQVGPEDVVVYPEAPAVPGVDPAPGARKVVFNQNHFYTDATWDAAASTYPGWDPAPTVWTVSWSASLRRSPTMQATTSTSVGSR